jgi:hypothetical protein
MLRQVARFSPSDICEGAGTPDYHVPAYQSESPSAGLFRGAGSCRGTIEVFDNSHDDTYDELNPCAVVHPLHTLQGTTDMVLVS